MSPPLYLLLRAGPVTVSCVSELTSGFGPEVSACQAIKHWYTQVAFTDVSRGVLGVR